MDKQTGKNTRKAANRTSGKAATKTGSVTDKPDINLVQNETDIIQEKRKRGRPKGSKNKTIRKDKDIQTTEKGKNRKAILFSVALSALPYIDINNPLQVKETVSQYFDICSQFDLKPTVAALAMAFHIDRATLFNWLNHKTQTIKNKECFDTIKQAYNQITLLYETYLTDGSIIPVSGFFLMKNNMGYKDTTDYIISTDNNNQPELQDIVDRAGLLTDE